MISCQPSPASRRAAAWPSPEVVPVTRAIECSMGVSVVKGEGRVVRPREIRTGLLLRTIQLYIGTKAIVKEFLTEWFRMPLGRVDGRAASTRETPWRRRPRYSGRRAMTE